MIDRETIKEIFLANGFTIKEDQTDLKEYVYVAAEKLIEQTREVIASKLIDVWCANHGGKITWQKCIEITAIVTKMPDEEKQRLLDMD